MQNWEIRICRGDTEAERHMKIEGSGESLSSTCCCCVSVRLLEREGGREGKPKMEHTLSLTHSLSERGVLPRGTESTFFFFFFLLQPSFLPSLTHTYISHNHGSRNRTSQVRFGRGCYQGHRYEQRKKERDLFTPKCLLRFHLCLLLHPHCNLMERKRETNYKDSLNGQQEHRARTNSLPTLIAGKKRSHSPDLIQDRKAEPTPCSFCNNPDQHRQEATLGVTASF